MSDVTREEINKLTDRISKLESNSSFGKNGKRTSRKKRAPSTYNLFIGAEIPKIKKKNPGMAHTEAFSAAVAKWNKQKS